MLKRQAIDVAEKKVMLKQEVLLVQVVSNVGITLKECERIIKDLKKV